MSTLIEIAANAAISTVLAVACYVLGNRRAVALIEYRDRQAARVATIAEDGSPIYRKCLCGHNTTSHTVKLNGERGGCKAALNNAQKQTCACDGYIADPGSRVKTEGVT